MVRRAWSWGFGVGVLAMALAACGSAEVRPDEKVKTRGDRSMVSHSEGIEPEWIQQCPAPTDHNLPFCGESHEKQNQQVACAEAYADALGKLSRAIGQKVDAALEPDGQGGYRFRIQSAETEPITIRGVWEDQGWFEEYSGPTGRSFDCYKMLVYPKIEFQNILGMAQQAALDRVLKATQLHTEGKELNGQGRFAEAAILLDRAQNLLLGLKEPVVTPEGTNSALLGEQIGADLKLAREESGKTSKTALLVLNLVVDEKPQNRGALAKSIQSRVTNWISGQGLKVRPGALSPQEVESILSGDQQAAALTAAKKGAGLLLVLDLQSEYLAFEDSIHFANARGTLRLIRTSDGREIAASDIGPEKQGHPRTRDGALTLCVEKLRDKLLEGVVKSALAKI